MEQPHQNIENWLDSAPCRLRQWGRCRESDDVGACSSPCPMTRVMVWRQHFFAMKRPFQGPAVASLAIVSRNARVLQKSGRVGHGMRQLEGLVPFLVRDPSLDVTTSAQGRPSTHAHLHGAPALDPTMRLLAIQADSTCSPPRCSSFSCNRRLVAPGSRDAAGQVAACSAGSTTDKGHRAPPAIVDVKRGFAANMGSGDMHVSGLTPDVHAWVGRWVRGLSVDNSVDGPVNPERRIKTSQIYISARSIHHGRAVWPPWPMCTRDLHWSHGTLLR